MRLGKRTVIHEALIQAETQAVFQLGDRGKGVEALGLTFLFSTKRGGDRKEKHGAAACRAAGLKNYILRMDETIFL